MITFVLLAAALTVAGVLLVAVPLLRRSAGGPEPAPWSALAAAGVLVVGSAVLYVCWSNWPWRAAPAADSPQRMVARLARELEHDPGNLGKWLMLGRSYVVLQEYGLAVHAFERADRLSHGSNIDALTGEAEALALGDQSTLDGRAGRLIERALALAPDSGKALFFGAAVAMRRGDLPLARQRLTKLLAMNPPDNIRALLEQQLSAIDSRLKGGEGAGARVAAGVGASTAAGAVGSPSPAAAAPETAPAVVRVNVTLGRSVGLAPAAPLFVFVRNPGGAGPPLAVKRLASRFPQTVVLTVSDAVIPGHTFSAGERVQVVARIARSGNPAGRSGDPFGEVDYHVGSDAVAALVIDRATP